MDLRRKNVPMPLPLIYLYVGERFGIPPWEVEEAPADRLAHYLAIMSLEGEFKAALDGVGPRDHMDWGDDEG